MTLVRRQNVGATLVVALAPPAPVVGKCEWAAVARSWATTRVAPTPTADMRSAGRAEHATAGAGPPRWSGQADVGATFVVALRVATVVCERAIELPAPPAILVDRGL